MEGGGQKLNFSIFLINLIEKMPFTFHKFPYILYTGCSKKKDQKYWAITQLKKVFRGCFRVHLDHKYPTFDKIHQGSQVYPFEIDF